MTTGSFPVLSYDSPNFLNVYSRVDEGSYASCGKGIVDRMEAEGEDVIHLCILLFLCVDRSVFNA